MGEEFIIYWTFKRSNSSKKNQEETQMGKIETNIGHPNNQA